MGEKKVAEQDLIDRVAKALAEDAGARWQNLSDQQRARFQRSADVAIKIVRQIMAEYVGAP